MTAAFPAPAATRATRNRSRKTTCRQMVTAQTHAKFVMRPHARCVMCPCKMREVGLQRRDVER